MLVGSFIFGKEHRLKEEPNTMREEDAGPGSNHDQVDDIAGIIHVHHHAADLWDVEFKVNTDVRVEIWIDSAPLEVDDCLRLVSVELEEAYHRVIWVAYGTLFDSKPFLESSHERDLLDLQSLLAAETAAEQVIAWAKESPAATWLLSSLTWH